MSSARVIAEHESADSDGSIAGSSKNLFAKMAASKTKTEDFTNMDDSKQGNAVSFDDDMIGNAGDMNRTESIMG